VPAPAAKPRNFYSSPNHNDEELYCLQVGSFRSQEAARELNKRLKAAGFNAVIEFHNDLHRVLVVEVPSGMVQYTVQKLGNMGLEQIWVR
jgi:cell division septation protein DedD